MAETGTIAVRGEAIKPRIGFRVLNTKDELLSGHLTDELLTVLEQTGVLLFPQLNLTDAEQVAFTNALGGNAKEIQGESVFKVTLDVKKNPYAAEYLKGSLYWHIDGTMNPIPIRASMLTAKALASEGGDTEFANTATAYDDLPDDTKARIEDLRVVHSLWRSQLYHTPEPTVAQLEDWFARGESELPLVCKHKSGRKSLILGNTAHYVKDVSPQESYRILHGLRAFATGDDYSFRHQWTVGDTVIWDNRTSLHRATPYDPMSGRMMHRTILDGTEAWESNA
jgi:alpha-ketoglutarate-dependent taurine dioxygenase